MKLILTLVGAATTALAWTPASMAQPPALVGAARMPPDLYQAILAAPADAEGSGRTADIPAAVFGLIGGSPETMADAGGFYNLTDVVLSGSPRIFSRLVWTARVGDFYIMATEHGGIGSGGNISALHIEPSGKPRRLWSANTSAGYTERVEPNAVNRYRTFAAFKAAIVADTLPGPTGRLLCDSLLPVRAARMFLPADGSTPRPEPVAEPPASLLPILNATVLGSRAVSIPEAAAEPPSIAWTARLGDAYVVQYRYPDSQRSYVTIAYDPPKDQRRGYWTGRVKAFDSADALADELRRSLTPTKEYELRQGLCRGP